MGIEPTLAAWEAAVLPLNYTRIVENCTRGPVRAAIKSFAVCTDPGEAAGRADRRAAKPLRKAIVPP